MRRTSGSVRSASSRVKSRGSLTSAPHQRHARDVLGVTDEAHDATVGIHPTMAEEFVTLREKFRA